MAFRILVAFLVLSVMLENSGLCKAQGFECVFYYCPPGKGEIRDDPDLSPQIPLNEYRRNKLSRLEEFLRNKRNRFVDDVMLNEE